MQGIIQKPANAVAIAVLLVAMNGSLGCAFGEIYWSDPLKREFSLSEIQKRYTALVRFGAFVRASQFVDPQIADEFVANFPSQGDLVFTDHEIDRIEFEDEDARTNATVRVTYSAYYTHSPVVFEIVETQRWYREGVTNNWRVRPEFAGLEKFVAAN